MADYIEGSSALEMAAPLIQCPECEHWFHRDELTGAAGQYVCEDCLGGFLQKDSTVRDYTAEFMELQEAEFFQWMFFDKEDSPRLLQDNPFLSREDKVRWLRMGWEDWKKFHPEAAAEAQRDFIHASPGEWEDYLKGIQIYETV